MILNLPDIVLTSHTKFQILLSDRVPILIHHHDGEKGADGAKEIAVDIMLSSLTELNTDSQLEYLTEDKKGQSKQDITQRPAIIQSIQDQNDLHHHVDEEEYTIEDKVDDEESCSITRAESSSACKCTASNKEDNGK